MIESMKKLSLLMLRSSSESFIDELQELGVMHVEGENFADNEGITEIQDRIITFRKTEQNLHEHKENETAHNPEKFNTAEELCEAADKLVASLTHLHVQREAIQKQIISLKPWNGYNPEILSKLAEKNIRLRFFSVTRSKFSKLDLSEYHIEIIGELHKVIHFVIVDCNESGEKSIIEIGITEEAMPEKSVSQLQSELSAVEDDIRETESLLGAYYKQKELIDKKLVELEDRKAYLLTTLRMTPEAEGEILQLIGYIPRSALKNVTEFMDSRDVVYVLEEPENKEDTPIKLKNRAVSRLFEPITKMYGLPQYSELDMTPFMAPFFAFFFGVCLADVGYGLIILIGSLALLIAKRKKSIASFLKLGIIFGVMTVIAGVLLNTLFGTELNKFSLLPEGVKSLVLFPDPDDKGSPMLFALVLGIAQMLFGLVLQMINRTRQHGIAGLMVPLGIMLIMLGIFPLLILKMAPGMVMGPVRFGLFFSSIPSGMDIFLSLIAAGTAFVLFFNSLESKIWIRPLKGLWELYNIIVGLLGDFLSYVRLFALGLAGLLLGSAWNQIAMMIKGDNPGVGNIIGMVAILLFGHGITFALGALGAFVHPLRLTFVEFYKAVGFNGGGKAYNPFIKKLATNNGGKK